MDESPLVTSAHVSGDIAAISDDEIDELALLEDARRIDPHMREYCEQLLGAQRREALLVEKLHLFEIGLCTSLQAAGQRR